ncbi:MAG: hypothetical protein AB4206_19025 [Xenococcaceae cyanobacterium]
MKKRTRVTRRAHREMSALFNSSGLLIGLILVLIGVQCNRFCDRSWHFLGVL